MLDSFLKLILGDMDENRAWRRMTRRARALPSDYRYAFRKIKHYLLIQGAGVDGGLELFSGLLDLFEASAAEGRPVLMVTGHDVAAFCDALVREAGGFTGQQRQSMNDEILEKLGKGGRGGV